MRCQKAKPHNPIGMLMKGDAQMAAESSLDHRQGETMFGSYWSSYGARSRDSVPPGLRDVYCDVWVDGSKEGGTLFWIGSLPGGICTLLRCRALASEVA